MLSKTTIFETLPDAAPFVRRAIIKNIAEISCAFRDIDNHFVYIGEGEADYTFHGKTYRLKKGMALLVEPNIPQIVRPIKPGPIMEYIMLFDLYYRPGRACISYDNPLPARIPAPGAKEMRLAGINRIVQFKKTDQSVIERSLRLLVKEMEEKKDGYILASRSLCLEILTRYLRTMLAVPSVSGKVVRGWEKIEKAIRYIHEHYAEESLAVADICRYAAISESYLFQLFSKVSGISVHRYLINVRIEHAQELIKHSEKNFKEIAALTGFSGNHHFSKTFKQVTGVSPSDYVSLHCDGKIAH